jgi:TPR repeat protein
MEPFSPSLLATAEAGDADAQAVLGRAYLLGLGVRRDPAAALGWLRRAEAAGLLLLYLKLAPHAATPSSVGRPVRAGLWAIAAAMATLMVGVRVAIARNGPPPGKKKQAGV